jgi:hypothetical protein
MWSFNVRGPMPRAKAPVAESPYSENSIASKTPAKKITPVSKLPPGTPANTIRVF